MALSLALGFALVMAELGAGRPAEAAWRRYARRARPQVRKACGSCERQRALFRSHGVVTWRPYQSLCLKCRTGARPQ